MMLRLRRAGPDDAPFLTEMLLEAAFWRPGAARPGTAEALADPRLRRYVEDWGRPGDLGVVAEDATPMGAAWWRHFEPDAPGYGWAGPSVPELAMGVRPGERGRGIGTALLGALVGYARERHVPALSLSVERDNPAARLYERAGFRPRDERPGAVTMVYELGESSPEPADAAARGGHS